MRWLLALAAIPLAAIQGLAGTVVIEDTTVIDVVSGTARPHWNVVIDGDKIARLGPAASTPVSSAARIIDGRGKFVIPGLWDMHVHLFDKANVLPLFLAYGVTGVQDMGSDFKQTAAWRSAIEQHTAIGPHIITCGPPISGPAPPDPKLPFLAVTTPVEARKAFDKLWDMDVDFVKILSGVPRDAYFALAEQTRHWELRMEGHLPPAISAWEAIHARQRTLEHLYGMNVSLSSEYEQLQPKLIDAVAKRDQVALKEIDEEAFRTFSESKALEFFTEAATYGTYMSPTLTLWWRMSHMDDDRLANDPRLKEVPASIRATWPDLLAERQKIPQDRLAAIKDQLGRNCRLVSLMRRTPVRILAGTDTGDPYTIPGAALHDELALLVDAGLTPAEALRSATIAPAQFLGWEDAMGSIDKGKLADLVLLDANPLENIHNTRKISGVFARGTYFGRADLNAILDGNFGMKTKSPGY